MRYWECGLYLRRMDHRDDDHIGHYYQKKTENTIFHLTLLFMILAFQKSIVVLGWTKLWCGNNQIPLVCSSYQVLCDKPPQLGVKQ